MAASVMVWRFHSLRISQLVKSSYSFNFHQERHYAKRKNTNKAKTSSAAKVSEAKRLPWLSTTKVDPTIVKQTRESILSAYKPPPVDDVWVTSEHRPPLFNIEDVLNMHRESHHSTVYNDPDGRLYASFLLDMSMGETKTKPLDAFRGLICYPNLFDQGQEKRVLAIVDSKEEQEAALKNGACKAGGFDVIDLFKSGDITHADFEHVVVHQDMVTEMAAIRSLIKHHFPSKQRGTIGADMGDLVYKFVKGVEYRSEKNMFEVRYAQVDVLLGRLLMEDKAIEENLKTATEEVNSHRPKNVANPFILSVAIWSPPSAERLCIPYWEYVTDGYEAETLLDTYTTKHFKENSVIM